MIALHLVYLTFYDNLKLLKLLSLVGNQVKLSKFHFACSLALRFFNCMAGIPSFLFQQSALQTSESCFWSYFFFPKTLQAVSHTFSVLKLANSRNSLLIFLLFISTEDFEKAASYFSTSILLFHKLMFSASELHFLQQKLASQHSAFALSATIFFSADAFAEGYNKGLTRVL